MNPDEFCAFCGKPSRPTMGDSAQRQGTFRYGGKRWTGNRKQRRSQAALAKRWKR